MSENKPVFDGSRQVEIKLQSAEGTKTITVRFPTDAEWVERQRRRKIIVKQLGRGVSETVVPGSEDADAELLAKLRVGDGPEVHRQFLLVEGQVQNPGKGAPVFDHILGARHPQNVSRDSPWNTYQHAERARLRDNVIHIGLAQLLQDAAGLECIHLRAVSHPKFGK